MRTKTLSILLGISLLLNVTAGVVFIVYFNKLNHNFRVIKRERAAMVNNLSAVRMSEIAADDMEGHRYARRQFWSLVDGQPSDFVLMPPSNKGNPDNVLIVYLHGMCSNDMEPFMSPATGSISDGIAAAFPNSAIVSCAYRGSASWGSDAALSDVTQNIREILQEFPFKRIVLMGTSMGGCTSLLYSTCAPQDIKDKLAGVVSVEGAGDLKHLYEQTENSEVKAAIITALGGTPEQAAANYQKKSFLPNLGSLPPHVRVAIVSAKQDKIVPPPMQQEVLQALQTAHVPVTMMEVDAGHGAPSNQFYIQGLQFVLSSAK